MKKEIDLTEKDLIHVVGDFYIVKNTHRVCKKYYFPPLRLIDMGSTAFVYHYDIKECDDVLKLRMTQICYDKMRLKK